jgi:radical SAM superfamily enzyme YgiQ (UPF0313 family)
MKVALVYLEEGLTMTPPTGLVYLATYLEKKSGFRETVIVDGVFDDIHGRLKKLKPDLIGISAMSLRYGKAIRTAREIRSYSKAPIIIGGVHISTMPHSFNEVFDLAVLGEGEETFREVVESYLSKGSFSAAALSEIPGLAFRDGKGLVLTQPRPLIQDLDEIPHPDWKYVDERYFGSREEVGLAMIGRCAPIMTARGCPYRCVFCSTSTFWDHHRNHSVPYVVENVRYLVEDLKIKIINIQDDMFVVNKNRLKEFRSLMEREGLLGRVTFTCNARSNHIDDEMCGILRDLSVRNLNFGFESGSNRMLNYLKVGSITLEKNKNAIKTCKRHGLVVYGSLMMGVPGETVEDMRQTLDFVDFAKEAGADYIWSFVATPFPKTGFWEEAKKRGKVTDDMDWEDEKLLSLHAHAADPPLSDVDPKDFRRLFAELNSKLRGMRYRLVARFLLKNPLGAARLFLMHIPHYFRRFYFLVFRF